MFKPLAWLESSVFHRYVHVWGRPCWVGRGRVWGHLLFTPKDRFSTGDKFGIRRCRNSPAENEQQPPGAVGRAAPPQSQGGPQQPHHLKEVEGKTPRVEVSAGGGWQRGRGGQGALGAAQVSPCPAVSVLKGASQNSGPQLWAAKAVTAGHSDATALFRRGHLLCG